MIISHCTENIPAVFAVIEVQLLYQIDILRLIVTRPQIEPEAVACFTDSVYTYDRFYGSIVTSTRVGDYLHIAYIRRIEFVQLRGVSYLTIVDIYNGFPLAEYGIVSVVTCNGRQTFEYFVGSARLFEHRVFDGSHQSIVSNLYFGHNGTYHRLAEQSGIGL